MTGDDISARFAALPALVNANTALVRRGRFLSDTFLTGTPDLPVYITVRHGIVEAVDTGPALMRSWTFAIRAEADAWRRFWGPMPPPGCHDLLAMARYGKARIEGDLQPLMANLRYVKEVLEAPRRARIEAAAGASS